MERFFLDSPTFQIELICLQTLQATDVGSIALQSSIAIHWIHWAIHLSFRGVAVVAKLIPVPVVVICIWIYRPFRCLHLLPQFIGLRHLSKNPGVPG